MIKPGVVSVTFRSLDPKQVIELTASAGLAGIEWGGDIHVPEGDMQKAKGVGQRTRDAGMEVASYGSYFRLGEQRADEFALILKTAQSLGAPNVRVWAGRQRSDVADRDYHALVQEDSRRIADMARDYGMTVSYEYHDNTVTDTKESTLQLLQSVQRDNVLTYWQMMPRLDHQENVEILSGLLPYLSNFHVFYWTQQNDKRIRHPLGEGRRDWMAYLKTVQECGGDHWALIEFVQDDNPQVFLRDAATLTNLLAGLQTSR